MSIKIRRFASAFAGVFVLALSACSTPSINPIYSDDENEVVTDDRVVGVWAQVAEKKDNSQYHVDKRADEKTMWYPVHVTSAGDGPSKGGAYEMRLVKLGAHTYADFYPTKSERSAMVERLGLAAFPMHVIFPVTIGDGRMVMRPLETAKVKQLVLASPKMTPHAIRDDVVVLTGETRQVQEFFRKIADGDEVFGDDAVLLPVKDAQPGTEPGGKPATKPAGGKPPAGSHGRDFRPR